MTDIQHDAVAELFAERQEHERDRAATWMRVALCAAALCFLALVILGYVLFRDQRVIVPPVVLHDDGVVENYRSYAELTPSMRLRGIEGTILRYVFCREKYFWSYPGMKPCFDFVVALSSSAVAAVYKRWFDPGTPDNPNSDSPQVYLGEKGQIDLEYIGMGPRGKESDLLEAVRFKRSVILKGEVAKRTRDEAQAQYSFVDIPEDAKIPGTNEPVRDINPFGIQVVRYQVEEQTP